MDRGILAIILVCISVIAASCGTGNDYSKDIGTAPGAQTQFCTPQTAQRGEQPSPTAVNPHPVPPSEAMFGFDAQHTSYNPYERTLTPTNVSKLVLKWTAPTAKPLLVPGLSSPTVANGVVYAASNDGKLYAFNATTGAVLWSTCIGNTDATPAVVNGVVYIGSGLDLYALDADTGAVLWTTTDAGSSVSSPVVDNGVVYVGSGSTMGKLYAVKADTGAVLWTVTTDGYLQTSPAVANGVVYIQSGGSKLYAVKATTGILLWNAFTDTAHSTDSSPAVVNGIVYIGSGDGKLYALNADTGAVLWSVIPNPESGVDIRIYATPLGTPAVANGIVYVNLGNFKVFAYHLPG